MTLKCSPVRQLDRICFTPLHAIRHLPSRHQYATRSQPEVYDQPVSECSGSTNCEQPANVPMGKNKHHRKDSASSSNGNHGETISPVNSNSASLPRSFLFDRNRSPGSVVETTPQSSFLSGFKRGELLERLESDFRQSVRKNEVQRRHKPFDRKSIADPYARMVASPIRRCAITGAKLPKDFMIRLRQVSVYFPATDSTASPPSAETSSSTQNKLSIVRKTYIVPSGLIHDSSQRNRSTDSTPTSTNRVGKSKYVLCRADTFKNLSRKKDRKSLWHDVEMSPRIIDQITHELQERVYLEMQRLCEAEHHRRVSRGNEQEAKFIDNGYIEADALDPLLPDEIQVIQQLRMPDRLSKRTVYAFLDLEDGPHQDSSQVQSMDMPMLYLRPANAPAEPGIPVSVPLFKFGKGFPSELSQRIRALLQQSIHSRGLHQSTMIALCSELDAVDPLDVKQDSGRSNELDSLLGESSCVQLFIALWRLRLWKGMGWTVPVVTDEKQKKDSSGNNRRALDTEAETNEAHMRQEESAGQILQGFDVVQGVMHGKWQ